MIDISQHLVTHALLMFLEANLHVESTCFNGCNSVMVRKLCTCELFIQSILQATQASIYLT